MWVAGLTPPVGRAARVAAHRIMRAPIRTDGVQQDSARGDQTLADAVEPLVCPVCVVAVPGVGQIDPGNSRFLDSVTSFRQIQPPYRDVAVPLHFVSSHFATTFSGASFH